MIGDTFIMKRMVVEENCKFGVGIFAEIEIVWQFLLDITTFNIKIKIYLEIFIFVYVE